MRHMFNIPQDPSAELLKLLQFGPLAAVAAIDTTEDWLLGLRLGLPLNGIGIGPLKVLAAVWKGQQATVEECYAVGLKRSHFCKFRIPMVTSWINNIVKEGSNEIWQSKDRNTLVLWYDITANPGSRMGKVTAKAKAQFLWILSFIIVSVILQAYGCIALSVLQILQMLAVVNGMAGSSAVPKLDNEKQNLRFFIAAPNFSSDCIVLLQAKGGLLEGTLNAAIQYKPPHEVWKYIAFILIVIQALGVLYSTGRDGWDALVMTVMLVGIWGLNQLGHETSELWREQNFKSRLLKKVEFPSRKSAWLFCGLQSENASNDIWFEHVLPRTDDVTELLKLLAALRECKPTTTESFYKLYDNKQINRKSMENLERDIRLAYYEHIKSNDVDKDWITEVVITQ